MPVYTVLHDEVHNAQDDATQHVRLDPLNPQPTPNQRGESNLGDSSRPLFSIYSKAAEVADDKKVKSWQKDADGILIFVSPRVNLHISLLMNGTLWTGLFSAAVAALLTVTVQDLRPNSQDTSAFYLGNIYEVLADPNATRASLPSPPAKPPPFSPPRYAIWVNSLWFLSLVIGLTCALLATSLQQWARRYIELTQPAQSRCGPEKRARMHSFFSHGADEMHILWVVEQLPMLLHLSLFLFFGGLGIFLFNTDHAVFSSVIWWIGLFSIVYGLITVMPIIRHNSPYYAPLSRATWFLYAGMNYVLFKALFHICVWGRIRDEYQSRISRLMWRSYAWMLMSVEKVVEETVSDQSSEIDIRIFEWTVGVLGEDDSLEEFFEAVPGFFSSKLVNGLETGLSHETFYSFWFTMHGFLNRTFSSNSVIGSVKDHRADICREIMSKIPCPITFSYDTLSIDPAPVSIERLSVIARWYANKNGSIADCARASVAKDLANMQEQERDDSWITLASDVCGPDLTTDNIRDNIAGAGNNVLLATLIDLCRRQTLSYFRMGPSKALTQIDLHHTLPRLRHGFCTVWNELVQEARTLRQPYTMPVLILKEIRYLYIALHQGTDSAPTAFSDSTDDDDHILYERSSYPLCDIASHRPSHRPDLTPHLPITVSHTVPTSIRRGDSPDAPPYVPSHGSSIQQQAEQTNNVVGSSSPSNPTNGEIGGSSHARMAAPLPIPVHSGPRPTGTSQTGSVAAVQDSTSSAVPEPVPVLAPSSAPAPAPAPESLILDESLASRDSLPSPNAELHSLISSTAPTFPIRNVPMPRLHARRLLNTGGMCSVNAVLQLLVHSPPFWNLFIALGDLKKQRGTGSEIDGGATPLVDATVRFVEEFLFKEKGPPATQQPPQLATGGERKEDEEAEKDDDAGHPFEPTFLYHAMKENGQLKDLLVRPCVT